MDTNEGLLDRVVEQMGRLHVDLFLQVHFLINWVTVMNPFVRSKEAFALMLKVHTVDANMFAIKAALRQAVQISHIMALD